MRIGLSKRQWTSLKAEDNLLLVRSCFYLGYGMLATHRAVLDEPVAEQRSIISTAILLGMTDEDIVYLDRNLISFD